MLFGVRFSYKVESTLTPAEALAVLEVQDPR